MISRRLVHSGKDAAIWSGSGQVFPFRRLNCDSFYLLEIVNAAADNQYCCGSLNRYSRGHPFINSPRKEQQQQKKRLQAQVPAQCLTNLLLFGVSMTCLSCLFFFFYYKQYLISFNSMNLLGPMKITKKSISVCGSGGVFWSRIELEAQVTFLVCCLA